MGLGQKHLGGLIGLIGTYHFITRDAASAHPR